METQPLRVSEKFHLPNVTNRVWVNLWYCLQVLSKRRCVQSLLSQADDIRKSPFQLIAHGKIWTRVLWSESEHFNQLATCLSIYTLNDVKKWMETLNKHFYLGFLFLCWQLKELISSGGGGRGMWDREREKRWPVMLFLGLEENKTLSLHWATPLHSWSWNGGGVQLS